MSFSKFLSALNDFQRKYGVLAIIGTIVVATAGASFITGRFMQRLEVLEEKVKSNEDDIKKLSEKVSALDKVSVDVQKVQNCIELAKLAAAPKPPQQTTGGAQVIYFTEDPVKAMMRQNNCGTTDK